MKGKIKLTFSLWICGVLLLLWGCEEWEYAHERSKQLWPDEEGFPDREIVFLIPHESENDIFGFIRPDGSGLITRTVAPGYFRQSARVEFRWGAHSLQSGRSW